MRVLYLHILLSYYWFPSSQMMIANLSNLVHKPCTKKPQHFIVSYAFVHSFHSWLILDQRSMEQIITKQITFYE